jgi:hypothetical protein
MKEHNHLKPDFENLSIGWSVIIGAIVLTTFTAIAFIGNWLLGGIDLWNMSFPQIMLGMVIFGGASMFFLIASSADRAKEDTGKE